MFGCCPVYWRVLKVNHIALTVTLGMTCAANRANNADFKQEREIRLVELWRERTLRDNVTWYFWMCSPLLLGNLYGLHAPNSCTLFPLDFHNHT